MKRRIKKKYTVVFLIIIFIVGIASAMYLINNDKDLVYGAKAFYFNSDLLMLSGNNSKSYTLQNGVDTITVNLKNYEDKLRISEVDINYEVDILDDLGNVVQDKSNNTVGKKTGVLGKNNKSEATISFENLKSGSYTVTAISTSPYSQILTATFNVQGILDDIEYSVNDIKNSQIVQLTVKTDDYSGDLNITFPAAIIPDNTDSYFKNYNKTSDGNSYTVNFKNNSENNFKFFKSVPSTVYSKSDFTVVKE